MKDKLIVEDLLRAFTKYGYNCGRKNLIQVALIALSDGREFAERLEVIAKLADPSILPPNLEMALEVLDS